MNQEEPLTLKINERIRHVKNGKTYRVLDVAVGAGGLRDNVVITYTDNLATYARLSHEFDGFELVRE